MAGRTAILGDRHHENVSSASYFRAHTVPASSPSARHRPVDLGRRLLARGCGACPWVLLPVRVALLWVLAIVDPGPLAADWGSGARLVSQFERWRPPTFKAIFWLRIKGPTK